MSILNVLRLLFDFVFDKSSIDNLVTTKVAACGGLIDFEVKIETVILVILVFS
jgi:hypothetical protein